jgi:hypothetical protein
VTFTALQVRMMVPRLPGERTESSTKNRAGCRPPVQIKKRAIAPRYPALQNPHLIPQSLGACQLHIFRSEKFLLTWAIELFSYFRRFNHCTHSPKAIQPSNIDT